MTVDPRYEIYKKLVSGGDAGVRWRVQFEAEQTPDEAYRLGKGEFLFLFLDEAGVNLSLELLESRLSGRS